MELPAAWTTYLSDNLPWIARLFLGFLALMVAAAVYRRLGRSQGRDSDLRQALRAALRRHAWRPLVTALFLLALDGLAAAARLEPAWQAGAETALSLCWILLAGWTVVEAGRGLSDLVAWRYDVSAADNLQARRVVTRFRVFQKIFMVLVVLVTVAAALTLFEDFRTLGTTMLASAGVAGLVLGLSAQKTFGAVIAGVQVALTQPFNLDDVVIVEGEWGRIEEITFTYVVVRIWDMRRLIVPLTHFLDQPFQNWTRSSAEILGTVFLHVDYTAPLEAIRGELTRLCEAQPQLWDGKTCLLQVTGAGAETMELRALVSASDASRAWDLRCAVREGLIVFLQREHPGALPRKRLELGEIKTGNVVDTS